MRISCSLDIRSDPATVFSWLSDPERARVWMTSVAGTEILERKDGMVGTTFRERVEQDGGGVDMQGRSPLSSRTVVSRSVWRAV